MSVLYLSHSDCEKHVMSSHHPESPLRLQSIERELTLPAWDSRLERCEAREVDHSLLTSVHPREYLDFLAELLPGEGLAHIDGDTAINQYSLRAARLAAGAGFQAVEAVMADRNRSAFCATRPPGHHAESAFGMGFCVFNNIALAAERALSLGAQRLAILDFDVHHGNGTVEIFMDRPEVLVCSSFQYPFYPGRYDQVERPNIYLTPLEAGTASSGFRAAVENSWLPALADHCPDVILVSAGFDAHRQDPLGGLLLEDEDYLWLAQLISDQASTLCAGRTVSMLEGGYHLEALARSVASYLNGWTK